MKKVEIRCDMTSKKLCINIDAKWYLTGQTAASPTSWNGFPGKVCRTITRSITSMMRMGTLRRSQTEKERSSTPTIPVTS